MPSPGGYWLKRHMGGVPAIIMGVILLIVGLVGCYLVYDSCTWNVTGAKDRAGYLLMVGLGAVLAPTLVVLGTLAIIGGWQKIFPKKK